MSGELDVSIVIPCLNEANTIARVVAEAVEGIRASGLNGEVVVSDNGSTDGSRALAEKAGARVAPAKLRGYGAALHAGILQSKGRWVLFGDGDLSYDFRLLPRFAPFVRSGDADLVLGTRLGGEILPGAMPFLNRRLGTPVLNWVIRLFFGLRTTDCNSGMRLVRREFYQKLPMRAPGMEWASELLIKTRILGGRYAEVPITLRPDERGRPPHMRRWRDGWRHLKTIVLLAPNRLILAPSLAALALVPLAHGGGMTAWAMLLAALGASGAALGLLVKLVLHADGVRRSRLVEWLLGKPFPELLLGGGLLTCAASALWLSSGRGHASAAFLAAMAGGLGVLTSFAWGVLVTHCLHTLDSAV